jgi:YVTN family beta-propeller protein
VLEFRILGPFEVMDDGRSLNIGGPRQRALLAILVLRRGEVVSSDRLVDLLWGERAPATAAKTLQGYISHLRKALGSDVLLTRGGGYELRPGGGEVDADRFGGLFAEGRAALADGDAEVARERLAAALELWRGEPLADFAYEAFAQGEIARLSEARLSALEERLDADLALGRHRELTGELETLAAEHPNRERFLGQRMLALYRCGRQTDALEAFTRGRRALAEALGLEPGPGLRTLEQQIITHDPALAAPAPSAGRPPRPPTPPAQRRNGRLLILAGAALLLAGALAALIVELTASTEPSVRAFANSVAVIATRSGRVTDVVPVGNAPGPITAGAGSLWVGNVGDESVSRIDPRSLATLRTLTLGAPPTALAVARRAVWVVESSATAEQVSVSRIDPGFNTIKRTAVLGDVVPQSAGSLAASGNTLWVAPYAGLLSRLDTTSGRAVQQVDPNASPAGVAAGAGAVWVTDNAAGTVTRVDPTGFLTVIPVGTEPTGIAVGDGAVWVADTGDDRVVRIDPSSRAVTNSVAVGAAPLALTVGGGSVWVANSGDGTVTRIDPATMRVSATITVGGSPQGIAVSGGRAWVTVDAPTIPPARPDNGATLRIDSFLDVAGMDPALAYDYRSWILLYASCAKLVNYPDKGGSAATQLVPEVAQSLPAVSDGGRTYTFTIRPHFRFSPPSNLPVTAQTFKSTIERTLNPAMKSPAATEFDNIVGARAYVAGARGVAHISGVVARANKLIIHLYAPEPDLLARLAEPFFCAVPPDTPINPRGERTIPSAGPYYVTSYSPGQGVVLQRNPNYHGSRPHHFARIVFTPGVPPQRAVAQVEAGTIDYDLDAADPTNASGLAARYGPASPAAKRGRQQYYVDPQAAVDFLALNNHRPLFADARLRQAVNYAVDRDTLARIGSPREPLPEHPTDDYLPPGVPGYRDLKIYPLHPDLRKARALARGHAGATVVMYTCDLITCAANAQVVKTDLGAIGLNVVVKEFPPTVLFQKLATPGEPWDIGHANWSADYPDPDNFLNLLLETNTLMPKFEDPAWAAKLAAAARLTGVRRYLAYGKLDEDLLRTAAPFAAYDNLAIHDLTSARIGCRIETAVYGVDVAALCIRRGGEHAKAHSS